MMHKMHNVTPSWAGRLSKAFFTFIVSAPRCVAGANLFLACLFAVFLPEVVKDIRSDAFLADTNPALVYKNKVKEQFGLSDPLVIVVKSENAGQGIYTPETLHLLAALSEQATQLENIDPYKVRSLATENNIIGTEEGMEVVPFVDDSMLTPQAADLVRAAVADFPLISGSMVAEGGQAALILLEMEDEKRAEASYRAVMDMVAVAKIPSGVTVHVAGEGAILGYLGTYVDADAQQLIPLALLIITLVVVLTFLRWVPALVTMGVVVATLIITVGSMAAAGVPFYVVTNALPVILIGISVADAIHIYSAYFELRAEQPHRDVKEVVIQAMQTMWRPVTLTSLTTAAGFLGLYLTAYMPPFKSFGLFAAVGVMIAWLYSMTFLPAALLLTRPAPHTRLFRSDSTRRNHLLPGFAKIVFQRSRGILVFSLAVMLLAGYSAVHLVVDEDPMRVFNADEPVAIADRLINTQFNGSNSLDIVVETGRMEGLFDPLVLKKMEALQIHVETLPHVGGSVSIVDYLKQMHRALNGGDMVYYELPRSEQLIAQYFLLYGATADPADLEEEVDYDYQIANIRVNINSGGYQDVKIIVEDLQRYIDTEFNNEVVRATLSGRVNVHYRWISELAQSHFQGMAAALMLVFLISALLFRSVLAGLYTLVPVAGSVLLVYASMVQLGITLGMGTSMFAAVAIGLGIDFAIHTIERLQTLGYKHQGDMSSMLVEFYQTAGRALLFCFLATACGFGILMISKIPSLNYFGAMVALAVSVSFVASMTTLPAMLNVFKPGFLAPMSDDNPDFKRHRHSLLTLVLAGLTSLVLLSPNIAQADKISAAQVVDNLNQVDDGGFVTRILTMHQIDRRGKKRTRKTVNYRKYYETEKKMILFYLEPANVADTGFLIRDYFDSGQEDDQWLYLPAQRKVRRISAANRGDYFLGTDFTYEDMKLDGKLNVQEYDFNIIGEELAEGVVIYHIGATPKTTAIAKELGYSYMQAWIRGDNWMMIKAEFTGVKGKPLKTLIATDIRKVDGIWTRHDLYMVNHHSGHSTRFIFSDVDYVSPVKDDLFSKRALARGS